MIKNNQSTENTKTNTVVENDLLSLVLYRTAHLVIERRQNSSLAEPYGEKKYKR